jgi:hypothetical protein
MPEQQEPEESQTQLGNGNESLKQDEIIRNLIPDPTAVPDVRVLIGFLGRSPRDKYWRLYLTLELKDYIEFSGEDVVHAQSFGTEQNPLGGSIVWVQRDAKLQHTHTTPTRTQAEFLEGEVTQRFLPEIGRKGAIGGTDKVALAAFPPRPDISIATLLGFPNCPCHL